MIPNQSATIADMYINSIDEFRVNNLVEVGFDITKETRLSGRG